MNKEQKMNHPVYKKVYNAGYQSGLSLRTDEISKLNNKIQAMKNEIVSRDSVIEGFSKQRDSIRKRFERFTEPKKPFIIMLCPECGERIGTGRSDQVSMIEQCSNYCPNCGQRIEV